MSQNKGKSKENLSKSNLDEGWKRSRASSSTHRPKNSNILCRDYIKGTCKYGSRCKFKHSGNTTGNVNVSLNTESQASKPINSHYGKFRMYMKRGLNALSETQLRIMIQAMTESILDEDIRHKILEVISTEEGSPIFKYIINCNKKIIIDGRSTDKQISFSRLFIPFLNFSTNRHILDGLKRTYVNPFVRSVISNIDWESLSQALKIVVSRKSPIDKSIKDENSDELWTPKTLLDAWMPIVNLSLFIINSFSKEAVEKVEIILDALCQGYSVICEIVEKQKLIISSMKKNDMQLNSTVKDFNNKFSELKDVMGMKIGQFSDAKRIAEKTKELIKMNKKKQRRKVDVSPDDYPGESRPDGPRHDNDFTDITEIQIIPTENEILCQMSPYLPQNRAGHSSHIPVDGVIAHRDIHFRLLRHDLISQLQRAIFHFISNRGFGNIEDDRIFVEKKIAADIKDLALDIYRNVSIEQLVADKIDGVNYQLEFENLRHLKNKSKNFRINFWEKTRRLQRNTLACLVYMDDDNINRNPRILFGTISKRDEKLLSQDRPIINFKAYKEETSNLLMDAAFGINDLTSSEIFLLQAGPSFFAYRPILEALKRVPIPFSEYLLSSSEGDIGMVMSVQPPRYLSENRGYYNLTYLSNPNLVNKSQNYTKESLRLVRVNDDDKGFPDKAISELTTLDESQIEAMEAALMHELALIQGPPGTGKTYVGIQIIRALLSATPRPGPILCVCFTNHALDQFLKGILDCGITNLIRVGGRCKCEELQDYTLRKKLYTDTRRDQRYFMHRAKDSVEGTSERIMQIKKRLEKYVSGKDFDWIDLREEILIYYPNFEQQLVDLYSMDPSEAWYQWLHGHPSDLFYNDIDEDNVDFDEFNSNLPINNRYDILDTFESNENNDTDVGDLEEIPVLQFDSSDDVDQSIYNIEKMEKMKVNEVDLERMESSNRSINELLDEKNIWKFSSDERLAFNRYFGNILMRTYNRDAIKEELNRISTHLEIYTENVKDINDDMALTVLSKASVIGMTTTYVAMHQKLLVALRPKIIVVEEAAEVLEAHILTTLSADTEHLILIGDHEQLRPKLESYELQHDSGKGYDLDVSLFERLVVQGKVPHVTLQTQRRMRPSFSNLIRNTIYPKLADHPSVHQYPVKIPGMYHNLYFFDHDHPEDSAEEGLSKSNEFEALFAVKLSKYLMLQNAFKDGEIAIITPYVGQLLKIKKYMSECHINLVLEEKDKELLDTYEKIEEASDELKASSKKKKELLIEKTLSESVRLATIDNFQGEEARIVIISLTRNNKDGKIGFLGIKNRANVLLSRAKEGMYILGNAESLDASNSDIWHKVLKMLYEEDLVGKSIKLQCERHENNVTEIKDHKDFDTHVSDGGCQEICAEQLACGHVCRRQCHGDDLDHLNVKCMEKVTKIFKCGHAHSNLYCYKALAGDISCQEKITIIPDFCPHSHEINTLCYKADTFKDNPAACPIDIKITMPTCSHELTVPCGHSEIYLDDPSKCHAICGEIIPKCGHKCGARCGKCIDIRGDLSIKKHARCLTKCKKELSCGHLCKRTCHPGECPPCSEKCAITCEHKPNGCKKLCSTPCYPCAEQCLWECEHQGRCLLPCSAPCDRLPCDMRCTKKLECGCQCPSLCGEPCPSRKFCLNHAPEEIKDQDVDMILFKKFKDLTQKDINEDPLIVLSCGHAYLTSTLDGIMKIEENYSKDKENKWTSTKSPDPSLEKTETCPKCRALIISPMRYGRRINKTLVDKNEKSFIFDFEIRYGNLSNKLNELNLESNEGKIFDRMTRRQYNIMLKKSNTELYRRFVDLAEIARTPPRFHLYQKTKAAILQLEEDDVLTKKESKLKMERSGVYEPDMSRQCRARMGQAKSHLLNLYLNNDDLEDFSNYNQTDIINRYQVKASENFRKLRNVYKSALNLTQLNLEYYEKTQCTTKAVETRILNIELCIQMYLVASKICSIFKEIKNQYNDYQKEVYNIGKDNGKIALYIANTEDLRNKIQEKIKLLEKVKNKTDNISPLDILSTVLKAESFNASGHLYTCPNGHIYVIGECGGAMQESRCPECNALIGGRSHTLTVGNQAADHVIEQLNQRMTNI